MYQNTSKCIGLCLYKFFKDCGHVSFIFVSLAPASLSTPWGAPSMVTDEQWQGMSKTNISWNEWGQHQLCLPHCSGISVANHPTGLAFLHVEFWGACSHRPWVHSMEHGPGESERNHDHNQCLVLLLGEDNYWTLKLWSVTLALTRSLSLSQLAPPFSACREWGWGPEFWGQLDIIFWTWLLSNHPITFFKGYFILFFFFSFLIET